MTGVEETGTDVSVVAWVEQGKAPDNWSANRTRPLCVYPRVARYNGTGDMESASIFSCK